MPTPTNIVATLRSLLAATTLWPRSHGARTVFVFIDHDNGSVLYARNPQKEAPASFVFVGAFDPSSTDTDIIAALLAASQKVTTPT